MASSPLITTKFLLSNLHCPSCVTTIHDAFMRLSPKPATVSSSILSSWVVVGHKPSLPVDSMVDLLQNVGYEVVRVSSDNKAMTADVERLGGNNHAVTSVTALLRQPFPSRWSMNLKGKSEKMLQMIQAKHMETCEECRNGKSGTETSVAEKVAQGKDPYQQGSGISPACSKSNSPVKSSFVVIDSGSDGQTWRATFAVGGMTCQSCVNAVIESIKRLKYVKNVSVSLVTSSAVVEFTGKGYMSDITEALEYTGMEIKLHDLVSLGAAQPTAERIVDIQVNGMFCDRCPDRVLLALDSFGGLVHIDKPLRVIDPIMKVRYTPNTPKLTIRKVLDVLSKANPQFQISMYHPPSLEQLSAKLHHKQRNTIFFRVVVNVVIAIPTFIIGVVYMSLLPSTNSGRQYLGESLASVSRSQWALFILSTPVYFYSAGLFHERASKEIYGLWRPGSKTPILRRFYRFGSMNMLMSLGTSIAYISSLGELVSSLVKHRHVEGNSFYFDTVVFLTMFVLTGRLIEAYSKSRTGDAISLLGTLRPTDALLVENGHANKTVSVDLLEFGDSVRVLQGGSPPGDGIVIQGESSFDESSLTGESRLVHKTLGDYVYAGTVNKDGPITININGLAGNSMLDQIINAVRDGQTQHAPIEKLADSLTAYFVPAITLIAVLTWILWLSLGLSGVLSDDYKDNPSDSWVGWSLGLAIAVFVVACPCGIGLAAPTALVVGSGLAAQNGILAKGGGEAFEKASQLNCIVFDKTGTLTLGEEPAVTDFVVYPRTKEDNNIISMINALEVSSSHPVAKAVASHCRNHDLLNMDMNNVVEIAGKGMKACFTAKDSEDASMVIGNETLMGDYSVQIDSGAKHLLNAWKSQGKSVVLAAKKALTDDRYQLRAIFGISDPIRPESAGLVKDLQVRGIDIWLLSGDNHTTATAIGGQVGIPQSNIISGVLPAQKAEKIKFLQVSLSTPKSRALVAMVGDGINDAPALAAADVGIAIGSGSDIAISAADFVLISPDLRTVMTLLDLSKIVFRRIKFNFAWALVYNLIGVPIAAGVFLPVHTTSGRVKLEPVWASLAMALSSVSVVMSSLALRSSVPGLGFRKRRFTVVEESVARKNVT